MPSTRLNILSEHFCRINRILPLLVVVQLFIGCHSNVNTLLQDSGEGTTVGHYQQQEQTAGPEVTDDNSSASEMDLTTPLEFHPACACNAVVSSDRQAVYTISDSEFDGYSGVVTSRPLRDNEMFEIIHGDRLNESSFDTYYFDMGVTEFSPEDLEREGFPYRMEEIETGDWLSNYTLDYEFKAGDRVALTRLSNGTLRLFINRIDIGEVATGVPENVYGYVEIYGGDEIDISIAHPCHRQELEEMSDSLRRKNELRCALSAIVSNLG